MLQDFQFAFSVVGIPENPGRLERGLGIQNGANFQNGGRTVAQIWGANDHRQSHRSQTLAGRKRARQGSLQGGYNAGTKQERQQPLSEDHFTTSRPW